MSPAIFAAGCVVGAVLSLVGVLGLMVGAGIWLFGAIERGIEEQHPASKLGQQTSGYITRAASDRFGASTREPSPQEWNGWPAEKN